MTILHIDSSISGESSVSRTISKSVVDQFKAVMPGARVVRPDLVAEPLPHLTFDGFADSSIVDEFLAADILVIGAPMYNFGIPSQLKAWIDRIAVAGKTFRYRDRTGGPCREQKGRGRIFARRLIRSRLSRRRIRSSGAVLAASFRFPRDYGHYIRPS
jgi:FMN-dependent NADH-azoreductase